MFCDIYELPSDYIISYKNLSIPLSCFVVDYHDIVLIIEYIGRLARMSVLDTEVDGSNPGSSMLFP